MTTGRDRLVMQNQLGELRKTLAAKGNNAATGYDLLVLLKIVDDALVYIDDVDDRCDDLDKIVAEKTEAPVAG